MAKKTKITDGERAMYTFFISTLVGPFFAALMVALLALVAGVLQKAVGSLMGQPMAVVASTAGGWALQSYVWAAMPAGLAGAMLAAWVSLRQVLPWIVAVTAGVVAFGVASVMVPGLMPTHRLPLALIAGLASLGVWAVLRRARIVEAG